MLICNITKKNTVCSFKMPEPCSIKKIKLQTNVPFIPQRSERSLPPVESQDTIRQGAHLCKTIKMLKVLFFSLYYTTQILVLFIIYLSDVHREYSSRREPLQNVRHLRHGPSQTVRGKNTRNSATVSIATKIKN